VIVTRRFADEFARTGHILVGATDVADLEALGVPLYMGRQPVTGRASGPWAPRWAVQLVGLLEVFRWSEDTRDIPAAAVRAAMLRDDPTELAQAVAAAADLGGAEAVRQLLEGHR
jgi:hypothetical protein